MTFKWFLMVALLTFTGVIRGENELNSTETSSVSPINKLSLPFMGQVLSNTTKNHAFSPLSLSIAVAMAAEGANGETLTKVNQFFDNKNLHETISKINTKFANTEESKLRTANLVLQRDDLTLKDTFKTNLVEKFKAKIEPFSVSNLDEAKNRVNDFVANQTDNLIPQALDSIKANQVLLLVNTIFLDAKWKKPFTGGIERNFTGSKNDQLVSFMQQRDKLRHHHCPVRKEQVVEIQYKDGLSMLILLPDQRGGLSSVLKNLTEQDIEDHVNSLTEKEVKLYMPKFEIKSTYDKLPNVFRSMGIALFDDNADLSNMAQGKLSFDDGVHKAVVKVNELGTKAAAFTSLSVTRSSFRDPKDTVYVEIDHPFLFIIREPTTKTNLFVGTVFDIDKSV